MKLRYKKNNPKIVFRGKNLITFSFNYFTFIKDVQTLEELSLCVLSRLEEVVKEKHHWREITEAQVQLLRDFAFQEWLCSQSLEHYYHT